MNRYAIRSTFVAALLILVAVFGATGASAQGCPPGLTDDDCSVLQTAYFNTRSATSFALDFSMEADISAMGFGIASYASGSGVIVMDGEGNLIAADLRMPEAGASIPFMDEGTGAAAFVLVDGIAYFGAGDDLETLEWQSIEVTELSSANLTFDGFVALPTDFDTGMVDMATIEWTRADEGDSVIFSAVVEEGDLMEGMTEGLEGAEGMEGMDDLTAMLGGMSGTYSVNNRIVADAATARLTSFESFISVSADLSSMMEGLEGMSEEGEGETEGMEGMEDLFGEMMGGFGGTVNLVANFSGYDEGYTVTAPAESEPMRDSLRNAIAFSSEGVPGLLNAYFTALATEDMTGFSLGDGDFSMDFYFGNCTADYGYTPEAAGAITPGTLTQTLSPAQALQYTFDASAGDVVSFVMSGGFDGYLELLGPDGAGITSVDDTYGLMPALENYTLNADGTYTVVICGYSTSDQGEFNLEFTAGS